MSDIRPKTAWDSNDLPLDVVWASRLDGRFLIEVQRVAGDGYQGVLLVFDHDDGDKLLLEQAVGLSYGARFGPDVSDVAEWQDVAADFVDARVA